MIRVEIYNFIFFLFSTISFINIGVIDGLSVNVGGTDGNHKQFCPFFKKVDPPPASIANPDGKCAPKLKNCDTDTYFYTIDGSCNNRKYSNFGQAGSPFERLRPANFSDGYYQSRVGVDGKPLTLARVIRTTVLPNSNNYPAEKMSPLFYALGQYSSHDASQQQPINFQGDCCKNGKPVEPLPYECYPQIMPPNDEFYSKFGVRCVSSTRSTNTKYLNCSTKPVKQTNFQTAFLDLSIVYAVTEELAQAIRLGKGGLLKQANSTETNSQEYPFISSGTEDCPAGGISPNPGDRCFFSGDLRINQNPEIFTMNTLFFRFHNYLAKELSKINPNWDDQKLYMYARRISVAMYQHVLYSAFLPVLIGNEAVNLYRLYPASTGYASGYDPKINPQTFEEYTSTAGRSGHSTVKGKFEYKGPSNGNDTLYLLSRTYFTLGFFLQKEKFLQIINAYSNQVCERQDKFFTEQLNNYLFPVSNFSYGNDLSTLDIDRGREFGVAPYTEYRKICGLCELNSIDEMKDEIMDPTDVEKLKKVYRNLNDIDLYVGAMLEKPYKSSSVGPTFTCILAAQFYQWKYGDIKFYEFSTAAFTQPQLKVIRGITFTLIICLTNPGLEKMPKNAFYVPSSSNPTVDCSSLPKLDLTPWQDKSSS